MTEQEIQLRGLVFEKAIDIVMRYDREISSSNEAIDKVVEIFNKLEKEIFN